MFINAVTAYMERNNVAACGGFINYTCKDCKNLKQWPSMELIRGHLLRRGFMPNYMVWTKHGEEGENPPNEQAPVGSSIGQRERDTNVGEAEPMNENEPCNTQVFATS